MIGLEPFLWVAGALHGLIAVSNLAAARLYRYREEMAKVSPFVREVFYVQNAYIMATVGALGLACVRFADRLFLLAFLYLSGVFALAALKPVGSVAP